MKKVLSVVVATGLLAAQHCFALSVNISETPGYQSADGGEFTVTDASATPDPAFTAIYDRYAGVATVGGGFQSFCINTSIYIQGNPQNATLSPNGIAVGTAWLYSQFAHGTLAGYDYTDVTPATYRPTSPENGRELSAWNLQNAIWALQGQSYNAAAANVFLTSSAFTSVFSTLADAKQAANGQYGVDALDLSYTDVSGNVITSQPMLALVPDGGATLILLGLALGTLAFVSRKVYA